MSACSEACGHCGACTSPWERQEGFRCIVCGAQCELDNFEPFCGQDCKDNYDGPADDPDGPWSGGFAENH